MSRAHWAPRSRTACRHRKRDDSTPCNASEWTRACHFFLGSIRHLIHRSSSDKEVCVARKTRSSRRCSVCGAKSSFILSEEKGYALCPTCDERFFYDIKSYSIKIDRLQEAIGISKKYGITIGLSLNVAGGVYPLTEALRRYAISQKDKTRKTTDFFDVRRRLPGSIKN